MNTTQSKHTPCFAGNDKAGWFVQWQHGSGFRSAMPDKETAQQCVQACNAFYPMLEALEEAVPYLQYLASNGSGNKDAEKTCDMAEAALSLAKQTTKEV